MKHSQMARYIIGSCIVLVAVFSLYNLYRSFRPTRGLPYEQIPMEQAVRYMNFEDHYQLLDVGSREAFANRHIPGAINIPADELVKSAATLLPDAQQMIYVYADDGKAGQNAAMRLCGLGYTNITQITGNVDDYWSAEAALETEGWFGLKKTAG